MSADAPVITEATNSADYEAFGGVCRAYVDWCRARYRDMPWFVEEVFGYQSLDTELRDLAAKYGPPRGRTFIAIVGNEVVAGGAYRRLSDETCELKRLFVTDKARGNGLGRKLSDTLIAAAAADGFTAMKLDTGNLMKEAIAMYESIGFSHIPPYHEYPARLMPHFVFMQKAL